MTKKKPSKKAVSTKRMVTEKEAHTWVKNALTAQRRAHENELKIVMDARQADLRAWREKVSKADALAKDLGVQRHRCGKLARSNSVLRGILVGQAVADIGETVLEIRRNLVQRLPAAYRAEDASTQELDSVLIEGLNCARDMIGPDPRKG